MTLPHLPWHFVFGAQVVLALVIAYAVLRWLGLV